METVDDRLLSKPMAMKMVVQIEGIGLGPSKSLVPPQIGCPCLRSRQSGKKEMVLSPSIY